MAMKEDREHWHVYVIKTRLDTLYTGISTDVERRFKEHSGANKRGSRYLKGKGPLELVWQQFIGSKSDALKLEYRIKQLSRKQKEKLIKNELDLGKV
ncbi:GIY-YIG nuclease family protein [Marinomonas sp. C2222]|uniref:GIY-YIG nuclease family protein n=1 Tax=Marinomonas sargassi TaxID=2984494 RepID=A0ABT2YSD6_9GAMM|nr:GIY-YIG nuclease family protein [Marinomonas sargassi]MCV2402554.1 GIY-YIG nuclease family protein [Marinomonas sargassi]